VHCNATVAHWVRSYRARQGFLEHPPLAPALSLEGRGRRHAAPMHSSPSNEAALSPLRFDALRCSRSVRGSNERTEAGFSPQALFLISLRALALKAVFFGLLFDAKLIPWDFDSGRSALRPSSLLKAGAIHGASPRAGRLRRSHANSACVGQQKKSDSSVPRD